MKSLTIVGTIAMFLVGGNILMHGFHYVVEKVAHLTQLAAQVPTIGGALQAITPTISEMIFGMLAGAILMFIMSIWHKFFPAKQAN